MSHTSIGEKLADLGPDLGRDSVGVGVGDDASEIDQTLGCFHTTVAMDADLGEESHLIVEATDLHIPARAIARLCCP